ncbi:MAG: type II secretion system protein M [Xanthomonadaceae bacterium]|jgi:general secretion pathway protein M|nr:type II secretion system protein M [Xanthomonadaceae bacterium]
METTPSMRDRWLALALLLAALALVYLPVHQWWTVPMTEMTTRIDKAQERETRARALLAQAPTIEQQLQALSTQESGFLPEPTAELAMAGLVRRLETVVLQASPGNRSCAITNRTPLMQPAREKYERVTVMVRLRCGMPELSRVLYSLEDGVPVLFVNNFNVLADPYSAPQGSEAPGSGLDVSFELYGYLRPGAGVLPRNAQDVPAGAPQEGDDAN